MSECLPPPWGPKDYLAMSASYALTAVLAYMVMLPDVALEIVLGVVG